MLTWPCLDFAVYAAIDYTCLSLLYSPCLELICVLVKYFSTTACLFCLHFPILISDRDSGLSGMLPRLNCVWLSLSCAGSPVFPIVIGGLKVHDLGKVHCWLWYVEDNGFVTVESFLQIVHDRPAYHSERYLLPVGFESSRTYPSMIDPTRKSLYTCRILDGGEAPMVSWKSEASFSFLDNIPADLSLQWLLASLQPHNLLHLAMVFAGLYQFAFTYHFQEAYRIFFPPCSISLRWLLMMIQSTLWGQPPLLHVKQLYSETSTRPGKSKWVTFLTNSLSLYYHKLCVWATVSMSIQKQAYSLTFLQGQAGY